MNDLIKQVRRYSFKNRDKLFRSIISHKPETKPYDGAYVLFSAYNLFWEKVQSHAVGWASDQSKARILLTCYNDVNGGTQYECGQKVKPPANKGLKR